MEYQRYTIQLLSAVAYILVLWDVFVYFFNKEPNRKDTITGVVFGWAFDRFLWVLPFGWGVLGGHLFLPGDPLIGSEGLAAIVTLGSVLAVWVAGWAYRRFILDATSPKRHGFPWHALLLMSLGTTVGHYIVPVRWPWPW